jgi:glycosyltransferase involved in cell wall biosynthesis
MQIDDQTAAGIAQLCRYFDKITYYGIARDTCPADSASTTWVDIHEGLLGARVSVLGLPHAYGIVAMTRQYASVRRELRGAIAAHRHLCFTLGNIIGDWPAVAAFEAIRQKRRFAAWIDRVEPFVIRNALAGSPAKRLAAEIALPFTQYGVAHILRRSSVALLQGGDTYDHYDRYASDPHCTYDTHTHAAEQIGAEALASKQARILSGAPLDIVYVGRATAMKGSFDWLKTLEQLQLKGVPFRATWIGDGPDLPAMKAQVAASGLSQAVSLPGFENDRDVILQRLRDGDLFVFCHKTLESARCLIEALVGGCPIAGYDTAYPRRLTEVRGGSLLSRRDDVAALAEGIADLHRNRETLSKMVASAAASGELYNEDAVYAHRARLMLRG